jgi:hypothetical protein
MSRSQATMEQKRERNKPMLPVEEPVWYGGANLACTRAHAAAGLMMMCM